MEDERHPRRASTAEVISGDGVAVVYLPQSSIGFELNPSAYAIWNLCDGETSIEEIAGAIAEVTGATSFQALADVTNAISQFEEAGLLE